jgi:hypothetical protein
VRHGKTDVEMLCGLSPHSTNRHKNMLIICCLCLYCIKVDSISFIYQMKGTIHHQSIILIYTGITFSIPICVSSIPFFHNFFCSSFLEMDNNVTPAPPSQPNYSTELELTNAHLGLAYLAQGDMVKQHPHHIKTLHPVLMLESVRLGHLTIPSCHQVLLTDHLRNPRIIPAGD